MSDHVIDISIDGEWIGLKLRCTHADKTDLAWYGEYDEMGNLLSQEPSTDCWAEEWASNDGVVLDPPEIINPTFPMPVKVWFDGDSLRIEKVDQ